MVRRAPDGRLSLIDLIAAWTQTSGKNARNLLQRLTDSGTVPPYDTITLHAGPATPIVTPAEWEVFRQHIPCKTHMPTPTRERDDDDLYVMQYSVAPAVKIGWSRNVEQRRHALEMSQHFFVTLVASWAGQGHIEPIVHKRLEMFRSSAGAGKEWYNISGEQAVTAIQWLLDHQ